MCEVTPYMEILATNWGASVITQPSVMMQIFLSAA